MNPFGPDFLVGRLLITELISVILRGLNRLCFCFDLDSLYISSNSSVFSRLFTVFAYRFSHYSL